MKGLAEAVKAGGLKLPDVFAKGRRAWSECKKCAEVSYQNQFAKDRLDKEWFLPSNDLMEFIKAQQRLEIKKATTIFSFAEHTSTESAAL